MSGGSMDYVCWKIEEWAGSLKDRELTDLAMDLAKVFHDAEWCQSCDIGEDDYRKTVSEFKAKWFNGDRNERITGYIEQIFSEAKRECLELIGGDHASKE